MAVRIDNSAVKSTFKVGFAVWLIIKLIALVLTLFTEVDLTFLDPAVELAFESLVYSKDAVAGLVIFLCFIAALSIAFPLSFLVLHEGKMQNIVGFFALIVITILDIVSAVVLGLDDGMMILSLILSLLVVGILLIYGKLFLLKSKEIAQENNS